MLFWPNLASASTQFDHSLWDGLLKRAVHPLQGGQASQVDYDLMAEYENELDRYLASLSAVAEETFDSWSPKEQLAFLINAYNSWTVKLILSKYPYLESIKDLGSLFRSPWKKSFIPLLGTQRSLDDIEHGLIRGSGRYHDYRIHFAVNCASIGCPALRAEAYRGEVLDSQLEEATRLFLQDRGRNRLEAGKLEVSSIFKWYREDFEKGYRGIDSLEAFFLRYADVLQLADTVRKRLQQKKLEIDFLDYDWRLNSISTE